VTNSLVLWQVLADAGCRRVVLAGTCVEYDSTLGYFAEDSVIRPRTLYAASKHALWLMTEQFERGVGSSAVTARLFQIYGPGEHPDRLVSRVIRALLANKPCLLTEGRQLRDYLHVEDVARALWEISRSDIEGPINVGSASPVSVAAVAREIGHLLNRAELLNLGGLPARPDDPACLCARPGPLHGRLGWTPRYDLRTGLQYTIDWWKRHMRDAVVLPAM
jgi:nucleoside-diphosphate-sugar epimerase